LNKTNKYRDQIEYKTLTHVTRSWFDTWTIKKIRKEFKKIKEIKKTVK